MAIDPAKLSEKILALVSPRAAEAPDVLEIDVIADFVCPWSFLGLGRLREALQALQGGEYRLNWYPFQLNPDMPVEGSQFADYLRTRFGDPAALRPVLDEITRMGKSHGLEFDFDRIGRVPNTLRAHALVHKAQADNCALTVASELFESFFSNGRNIGDPAVLREIGLNAGMSEASVAEALSGSSVETVVRSNEKQARSAGITGVPNFLINKHVFVVGAQDTGQLVSAIDRAMFGDPDEQESQPVH